MADIFISYSKQDQDEAHLLATFLEAEGYSVWWDTSLLSGESFRKVIMTELGRARAVIVIWTEHSIHSDWVQSEAGRAHADRKLIPVKAKGLAYKDIPPPFDNMHIENLNERDKILGAVVAQLAKPEVEPSALWTATRTLRLQLLTWAGIVGGSLTLFSNLRGLIGLADWMRWIIEHWHEWSRIFWTTLFGWLGIHIPPIAVPSLSFVLFLSLLVTGTVLRSGVHISSRNFIDFAKWIAAFIGLVLAVFGLIMAVSFTGYDQYTQDMVIIMLSFVIYLSPTVAILILRPERWQWVLLSLLLAGFWIVLLVVPVMTLANGAQTDATSMSLAIFVSVMLAGLFGPIAQIIVATFLPVRPTAQRLLFVALGFLLLAALNWISVLGVPHWLEPPKPG